MQEDYTPKFIEEFWARVDKSHGDDACWIWKGGKNTRYGYGKAWVVTQSGPKAILAHRIAYEITYGTIAQGLCGLHKCDNTSCVNPRHIFAGTQKENMDDMKNKGRRHEFLGHHGEKHPMCKLSDEKVREIRQRFELGGETKKGLAREFGVDPKQIYNIVKYLQRT